MTDSRKQRSQSQVCQVCVCLYSFKYVKQGFLDTSSYSTAYSLNILLE